MLLGAFTGSAHRGPCLLTRHKRLFLSRSCCQSPPMADHATASSIKNTRSTTSQNYFGAQVARTGEDVNS
jgi:hypothetical protein